MTANDDLLIAGATGIASVAPFGSAAPTDTSALVSPWVDLGSISDDGLTEAFSDSSTSITPWGRLEPAKTMLTSSSRTFALTFWETNEDVLGLYFRLGAAPTPTSGTVSFAEPATFTPDYRAMVFDVVEGTNAIRLYTPKAAITDRGNIVYKSDTEIGYQVTVTTYGPGHRWYNLDAFA